MLSAVYKSHAFPSAVASLSISSSLQLQLPQHHQSRSHKDFLAQPDSNNLYPSMTNIENKSRDAAGRMGTTTINNCGIPNLRLIDAKEFYKMAQIARANQELFPVRRDSVSTLQDTPHRCVDPFPIYIESRVDSLGPGSTAITTNTCVSSMHMQIRGTPPYIYR